MTCTTIFSGTSPAPKGLLMEKFPRVAPARWLKPGRPQGHPIRAAGREDLQRKRIKSAPAKPSQKH